MTGIRSSTSSSDGWRRWTTNNVEVTVPSGDRRRDPRHDLPVCQGHPEAAFARGAAPITLIHGEMLIDLLIEHGVGVKKRTIELLEVDTETFTPKAET